MHVFYPFQRIFGGDPKLVRGTRYARGLARSWKICLEQEPSIVHFHFFQIPILDFIFLKFLRRRGYRIAITGHDITPFQISKLGLFWLRMIYRLADLIIVHTTGSKDELVREYDIQSSRVHIILHGLISRIRRSHEAYQTGGQGKSFGCQASPPWCYVSGKLRRSAGLIR